jgi:hypothetical protein
VLTAYVDEPGDTGLIQLGGSPTYTIGCILIDSDQGRMVGDGSVF